MQALLTILILANIGLTFYWFYRAHDEPDVAAVHVGYGIVSWVTAWGLAIFGLAI